MATKISWFGGHMARTVRELKVLAQNEQQTQTVHRHVHVKPSPRNLTNQSLLTSLQVVQERLRLVDLVLEVRDARIPFSSSNPELSKLVQHKQRLVILNKADLAASDQQQVALYLSAATHLHHALCRCSCSLSDHIALGRVLHPVFVLQVL